MELTQYPGDGAEPGGLESEHILGGLQAGVLGTAPLIAAGVVFSVLDGRPAWFIPNLLGTIFYSLGSTPAGFTRVTLAGLAVMVLLYGILGTVWGALWKERHIPLPALTGAITGFAVEYILFSLLAPRLFPLVGLYAPTQELRIGHILWGVFITQSPKYSRRIAGRPEPVVARPSPMPAPAAEPIATPPPLPTEADLTVPPPLPVETLQTETSPIETAPAESDHPIS